MSEPTFEPNGAGYLIFDVETVIDDELLAATKYPGCSPSRARILAEVKAELENGSTFLNPAFHVPVVVAVCLLDPKGKLLDVKALGERGEHAAGQCVALWWQLLSRFRGQWLVSYNGRGFDLPVLELAAMRHGLVTGQGYWNGSRDRYRSNHLDLQDVFANKGSVRLAGGLDLLCKLAGLPGKLDGMTGASVADLWEKQGDRGQRVVQEYGQVDVLQTACLFQRWRQVQGIILGPDYDAFLQSVRDHIEARRDTLNEGPLRNFLRALR